MTHKRRSNGTFEKNTHWRERKPHWDKEWLAREYVTNQRSTGEIATEIGTTDANVLYWLKKHGIKRRNVSGARAIKHWGLSGPDNPMYGKTGSLNHRYVDGTSPERQRLYAQSAGRWFMEAILYRDNRKCRRCGTGKVGPRSLHVHHIAPWANNKHLRFNFDNVVTLCRGCHSWVHSKANIKKEYLA